MTPIRVATQLLSACIVVVASTPASVPTGVWVHLLVPHARQVQLSSLQQIVEAVRKAVNEVEWDLRERLCSSCSASIGAAVVAQLLVIGHDLTWLR